MRIRTEIGNALIAKSIPRLLTIALVCLAVSCATPQKTVMVTIAPDVAFPKDETNTRLKLTTIPGLTEERPGGLIYLDVINLSHTPVGFAADFGVKVFVRQQSEWVRIPNNFNYGTVTYLIPPAETDPVGDEVMSIYPAPGVFKPPAEIRVVVVGDVYENNAPTGTLTAAYLDIVVNP